MAGGGAQFEGKDIIVFSKFDGMNTQSDRHDLAEEKAAWMENLQPIGPNNVLCVGAPKTATAHLTGETIAEEFFAPINGVDYMICFCTSGAAYAVKLSDGTKTKFANSGTFSSSPDMTIWNLSRILIADATSGYSTWDGNAFVQSGGVSPNILVTAGGSGYTSGATVAITGGSGSGATATVTVVGGVVTAIVLTASGTGYLAGDTLTFTISPVGAGSGATATGHVWPFLSNNATTLAVFQGRVWLGYKNIVTYTGTGASYGGVGYDDFKPSDASGTYTVGDADLVHSVTALRNLNNYLFIIGDSSVKQIGNITVSSSITNFTPVTLSSDQGTSFKNTVISYNRLVLFSNTVGVYAIFGSSVEKISDEMDGIFRLIDFTLQPSAAVNDINNIHCFLLLVKYKDPVKGSRGLILAYMNKKWFVVSQGKNVAYITTASIGGIQETFSTSGDDVTQILQDTGTAVDVKLQTSLSSHGAPYMSKNIVRYAVAQNASANNMLNLLIESERDNEAILYSVASGIQFVNDSGNNITFIGAGNVPINFTSQGVIFGYQNGNTGGVSGIYLGVTITGTVSGYSMNSIMLEYGQGAAFASTSVALGAS